MATRTPLVIINGQTQQLPVGDTVTGAVASDPSIGSYAPGAFTIADGKYAIMAKRLVLTGTQRVTIAGTGRLRVE
jgi:hypothetical protein